MNKCLEAILALGLTAGIIGCDNRAMKVTIEKPVPVPRNMYSSSHGGTSSTTALDSSCPETDDVYERAFQLLKSGKEGYSLRLKRDTDGNVVSGRCVFVAGHPRTYGTVDTQPPKREPADNPGCVSVEFWSGHLGQRAIEVEVLAFELLQRDSLEFELKNSNTRPVAATYDLLSRAAGCDNTVTSEELRREVGK